MGEVYKARDTRLGRTVAIKTSNARFTERFEREARAVAALSHPNICTLYDVGPDYLVMEYIDGKPLKGPLPVELVLRHAREIASALHAAHRLNIIHRDLKPANILVTKAGIKLLDFGLAKMNSPEQASEETVTRALTEEGSILGTLQYMSPEQLEGKDADARSDIFGFGCVLYEMLTGRMAFEGESRASIIAAILEREPKPLSGVPPALARAIQRAMAKDPDERWQSASDVAGVLDLAASAPESGPVITRTPKRAIAALAAVAAVALAAAFWLAFRAPSQITWSGEPMGGPAGALGPRVSPDGHTVAFQAMIDGQSQVGILKPETGNWAVLTHQKNVGQITDLAWSRDGSKIYFDRQTDTPAGVFSVPLLGGEPRMVLELATNPQVLADGSLMVSRINVQRALQLYRFWPESGKVEPLPALVDNTGNSVAARTSPDGKHIVFYGNRSDDAGARLGRGVFAMDPDTRELHQLAPHIRFEASRAVALAVTADGRSVILSAPSGSLFRLVQVPLDGAGTDRTLFTLTTYPWYLDVAADGSIYADQISTRQALIRFAPSGGAAERLTPYYSQGLQPYAVLHDGRTLAYTNAGVKRRFVIVEPGGGFSPLVESSEDCGPPAALVGDRQVAVLTDRTPLQIAIVSIADGRIVAHVPVAHKQIESLTASPDGKTFYYTSGGFVWSMPVAGGQAVRLGTGDSVAADPNGRELVVGIAEKETTRLMRLPVKGGPAEPIEAHGDVRLPSPQLVTGAVGPDGRIVVTVASDSQWAYLPGIVDPRAHTIARVPVSFEGEMQYQTWAPDGHLIGGGSIHDFTIWHFRPNTR
jgi:predicted Ser/Thr protein kinase